MLHTTNYQTQDHNDDEPGEAEEPKSDTQLGNPPETGRADKPRDRGDV